MKLKAGDIVMCINAGPIEEGANAGLCDLSVGQVYEVITDQSPLGGVRVGRRFFCKIHNGTWCVPPFGPHETSYLATRFYKLGSIE